MNELKYIHSSSFSLPVTFLPYPWNFVKKKNDLIWFLHCDSILAFFFQKRDAIRDWEVPREWSVTQPKPDLLALSINERGKRGEDFFLNNWLEWIFTIDCFVPSFIYLHSNSYSAIKKQAEKLARHQSFKTFWNYLTSSMKTQFVVVNQYFHNWSNCKETFFKSWKKKKAFLWLHMYQTVKNMRN